MQNEDLLFEIRQGVAFITLNRPNSANATNINIIKGLMNAALECDKNPEIRAVLLTGSGNFFCGGGDINEFTSEGDNFPHFLKEVTIYLHAAISRFARMDAPLIVAVNGTAGGVGMSLAILGDIVLAGESARFILAYSGIGLVPDGGMSYHLPRIVGLKKAIELTLTNRLVSSKEALDMGIVSRIIPDDELLSQATEQAIELAKGPTGAYGTAKRLFHAGFTETLETQLENEAQAVSYLIQGKYIPGNHF